MKIEEMIKVIGIEDVKFIKRRAGMGMKNQLTIHGNSNGVNYWEEATIGFLANDKNCKEEVEKIKLELKDKMRCSYIEDRELNKYLAVYELLYAINIFKGTPEKKIDLNIIKKYIDKLDAHIIENLDFDQISEMNDLKTKIKEDKLYRQLCFYIDEIKSTKDNQYKGRTKETNKYRFGNVKYCEDLDKVTITIYDNCIELTYKANGHLHLEKVDRKRNSTIEQKILHALDCWENYYTN